MKAFKASVCLNLKGQSGILCFCVNTFAVGDFKIVKLFDRVYTIQCTVSQ